MTKLSSIKKFVILVLVLLVPGFLYYLLVQNGKNRYHALRKFGPKTVAKTFHKVKGKNIPDTIYHTIGDFKLTDQQGKVVSPKTFDGKIFVADFFYASCPTLCNTMNGYVDSLVQPYAKNNMVYFASITVDPSHDEVKALKAYADKFNAPYPKWRFLTGDTSAIYHLARQGFMVNAVDEGQGNFIYSDKLMLVDSHKRIRGYYDATLKDIQRLDNEIKVLISEELLNKEEPLY